MRWDAIHLFEKQNAVKRGFYGIWTIPANRMKTRVEHRVPIIKSLRQILEAVCTQYD